MSTVGRSRRDRYVLAGAVAVLAVAGGGLWYTTSERWSVDPHVARLVPFDAAVQFAYVATDAGGTPVLMADGVIEPDGCGIAGRVSVGAVPVNPSSATVDIHAALDAAEATEGVGRIYRTDTEHVETVDGGDLGPLPAPWLEPVGAGAGLCEQLHAFFTAVGAPEPHTVEEGDSVDQAIATDDEQRGVQRFILPWREDVVTSRRDATADQPAATRVEVVVDPTASTRDGAMAVRIVIRTMRDGRAGIPVAAIDAAPYPHVQPGTTSPSPTPTIGTP